MALTTPTSPLVVTGEGTALTGTVTVTDAAGNSATFTAPAVRIDRTAPSIAATRSPEANVNGWNNTDVTVGFTASDALSGVESVSDPVTVITEGADQAVSGTAVDLAGNSASTSVVLNIDKTPPLVSGLPAPGCELRPPNHKLVLVATVIASDGLSGLAPGSFAVEGSSNEPENGLGDGDKAPDIVINGGEVQLRAERSGTGTGRIYTLTALVTDLAGNPTTSTATCTVPHNRRKK